LTDNVILLAEDAIQAHEKIIKDIKSIGIKIFPRKRIVSFEYVIKTEEHNKANAADAKGRAAD